MNNPFTWDKVWLETKNDNAGFWAWIKREDGGLRGKKILGFITKYLGDTRRIKTIEVGSGLGVYSFILAKRGAAVTLMDYSKEALCLAKKNFKSRGLTASFLCMDALNLDPNLRQQFDVAMSFGTIEHFEGEKRFNMAKAHFDLVRKEGVVIISVPNRLFFPHEILNFFLHRKNKWPLGYEKSFSRRELFRLAKRIGLKNTRVYGSAFITDFLRYIYVFCATNFFKKFLKIRPKPVFFRDLASPLDNLFGADIFLMGCKP